MSCDRCFRLVLSAHAEDHLLTPNGKKRTTDLCNELKSLICLLIFKDSLADWKAKSYRFRC